MKALSIVLSCFCFGLLVPTASMAALSACDEMKIARQKLEVVEMNIRNINTTRTPEGGPYRRRSLNCEGLKCAVSVSKKAPAMKYEPDHSDADESGYVAYPNMSLMAEMDDALAFTRDYEFAQKVCVSTVGK